MSHSTIDVDTTLRKQVHDALKLWHKDDLQGSPLDSLHLFQNVLRKEQCSVRAASNAVLYTALQELERNDEVAARILRMHYLDGQKVYQIASQLSWAEGTVYNKQGDGLDHLADIVHAQEKAALSSQHMELENRLRLPSYLRLFGVDEHMADLLPQLHSAEPPWIVAIAGMGGIGKTSLADSLVRRLIDDNSVSELGWVTAQHQVFNLGGGIRPVDFPAITPDALVDGLVGQLMPDLLQGGTLSAQERLTRLRARLKATPHLIVIDNLETLIDIESLLDTLRDLSDPTTFLLTTRESLFAEPDIYHFSVPALSQSHALALMRQEAQQRNLVHLLDASDAALRPIYETVGGNPLAIRLVVGQTHIHGLDDILHNLKTAQGHSATNLYTFIYRQAWDQLDEPTRRAFLAMPLATDRGATLDELTVWSQLERGVLHSALATLVRLNLVDSRGALNERRYSIHSLTRTFLHEQVIQWQ